MRTVGQARPAPTSPSIVGLNSDGAVDRKIATPWHGSPIVSASRSKPARIVDVERARNGAGEEPLGDPFLIEARRQMLLKRRVGALAEGLIVELGPRRADDPQIVGQQPIGVEPVERGKKHAPGKIAGRAEHQEGGGLLDHARLLQRGRRLRKGRNGCASR